MKVTGFMQARINYDKKVESVRKRLIESGENTGQVVLGAIDELTKMTEENQDFVDSMVAANTDGQYDPEIAFHDEMVKERDNLLAYAQGFAQYIADTDIS